MSPDATSLDRLHDIVEPPPVPWWPLAPGWWWLLGGLGVMALVGLLAFLRHWQCNCYRREALAELKLQEERLADPTQQTDAIAAIAELLKRTALSAWPRMEVASLHGHKWFTFLDQNGGTARFSSGLGASLEGAAYDPRHAPLISEDERRDIVANVRTWLQQHWRPAKRSAERRGHRAASTA